MPCPKAASTCRRAAGEQVIVSMAVNGSQHDHIKRQSCRRVSKRRYPIHGCRDSSAANVLSGSLLLCWDLEQHTLWRAGIRPRYSNPLNFVNATLESSFIRKAMAEAAKIVSDLRAAFALKSPDLDKCADLVVAFKLSLLKLPILPPFDAKDSNLRQNLTTARDGLELAVLVSLHESDLIGFELNFIQLKPYYYDFASVLTESSQMWPILGLHLLCLLAQSRIAEFHTELELLPIASHTNKFIAYPIALEQELMEGSYRSLWDASSNVPFPEYRLFVDFLVEAARDNVSECAEKAYRELTLSDAATLFKLTDPEALNDFCSKRGWEVKNNIIHFRPVSDSTFFIPAQHLIKQGLGYATELERIV